MNDKIYISDFETTSTENFKIENKVRVWAWNIRNMNSLDVESKGTSIESFFNFIHGKNMTIFFHNLKFDGQFIVYQLLRNGWTCVEEARKEKQFSCLIDECGQWFSIEIFWKGYSKNKISTKIFDSFKKIPLSVEKIAHSYNIDENKGLIDYAKFRPENYEPTDDEWLYIYNDTLIVAKALKEHFENGMTKMTIASDAYQHFSNLYSKQKFKYLFPKLNDEIHDFCKKAYKGGFVWLNPSFKKQTLKNVDSYDVNSLYPHIMRNTFLPYGTPKHFKGDYVHDSKFPLWIAKITCGFRLKKDKIPTIQLKNSFRWNANEYLTESEGETVELYLTSTDFKAFCENYDIFCYKMHEGYKFKQKKEIFDEYIDKFFEMKKNSTGGKKQIAKLLLNSLYGKFGSARQRTNMLPYLEKNEIKLEKSELHDCETKYIPMACFITANARYQTISSAQKFMPKNFVYSDTDSIHLVGTEKEQVEKQIFVDKNELGAWKYEGRALRKMFIRAKTYIAEYENEGFKVTCCGMPEKVKQVVTFDNFKTGEIFEGKLQQKRVEGGILLDSTTFKIKS